MTKREELEADLVMAEAFLADAVFNVAKGDGNQTEAIANLERARVYCRQARAALVNLDRTESIDTPIRHSGGIPKRQITASPPSTRTRGHTVRGQSKSSPGKSSRRKPLHRLKVGGSAQKPRTGNAFIRSLFVRQAIGLLALILAYLFYFQMDVQLQILSLPSIDFPLSEQKTFPRTHLGPLRPERIHK